MMETATYALVQGDEDGRTFRILNVPLEVFLEDPRGRAGVTEFVDEAFFRDNPDPQYWGEGEAMLIRIEVVVPRERTKAWAIN